MELVVSIFWWLLTAFTLIVGVISLIAWAKRGFWVPRYVHVLALFAFMVGALLGLLFVNQGTPLTETRLGSYLLALGLTVGLPAFVYFWFVFLGGAEAARETRTLPKENDPIEP